MARVHELASASPPYERVPNILRYTVNNLFIIYPKIVILRLIMLLLGYPKPCGLSVCHSKCKNNYFQRLSRVFLLTRSSAHWREMVNNVYVIS